MKTNEWLAYFIREHRGEFVERLEGEVKGRGFVPPVGVIAALADGLEADFEAEQFAAAQAALADLLAALRGQDAGRADEGYLKIWQKVEHLLGGYIAEEDELSGGARRLAYLRLSEFGTLVRGLLTA